MAEAYPLILPYEYVPARAPTDPEGFIQAFPISEPDRIKEFFAQYGFVVVNDVVNAEECEGTIHEVWEEFLAPIGCQRDDPSTWVKNWPWGGKVGMLGSSPYLGLQGCRNRENPNIYRAYATVFSDEDLIVNIDRIGMHRPTRGVMMNGEEVEMEAWKTAAEWLHFDLNPWTGCTTTSFFHSANHGHANTVNRGWEWRRVQGILALKDCREEDGGFHAVPGFHRHVRAWAEANEHLREKHVQPNVYDETTVQVPKDDPIREHVQHMPLRRGSLLIWDSALPHGNYPNNSAEFRVVQYIRMAPRRDPSLLPALIHSQEYLMIRPSMFPATYCPSELGKALLNWDEAVEEEKQQQQQQQQKEAELAAGIHDDSARQRSCCIM